GKGAREQASHRGVVAAHVLVEVVAAEDDAQIHLVADTDAEPAREGAPDQDSLAVARREGVSFDETEGPAAVRRVDRERRHALDVTPVADGGGEDQDRVDRVDSRRRPNPRHGGLRVVDPAAPSRIETHLAEAALHALL